MPARRSTDERPVDDLRGPPLRLWLDADQADRDAHEADQIAAAAYQRRGELMAELHEAGATWTEIGDRYGIARSAACNAATRARERRPKGKGRTARAIPLG